jgi:hypothetical protein
MIRVVAKEMAGACDSSSRVISFHFISFYFISFLSWALHGYLTALSNVLAGFEWHGGQAGEGCLATAIHPAPHGFVCSNQHARQSRCQAQGHQAQG